MPVHGGQHQIVLAEDKSDASAEHLAQLGVQRFRHGCLTPTCAVIQPGTCDTTVYLLVTPIVVTIADLPHNASSPHVIESQRGG